MTAASTLGKNTVSWGRNENKALRVTIDNPPDAGIAAWTFRFILYADPTETTALLTKTTGFTIVDSADTFELTITTADTSGLTPGVYAYRIEKSDTYVRLAWGPFIVLY